jgi:hypothetical protein
VDLKCLACLAEGKLAAGEGDGSGASPVADDAVTLAPSWQEQQIGAQRIVACIALPTCADHLEVARKSPLDLSKGIVLGQVER